jgi:cytochrome d ubiquinol oxidase subunit II
MFTWLVYVVQELFISGSSALNVSLSKDEGERKQIQVASGIHWDGIEVWLIVAIALTFAAFPTAFAVTFENLYIPIFLLLYVLIARGISIEVIYKLDNEKWVKVMKYVWAISSALILFIIGIYLTNIFLGFNYDGTEMTSSFLAMFNVTTIAGGLLFFTSGLIAGAGWLSITTSGAMAEKGLAFVKRVGVIYTLPVFLFLSYMGMNNQDTSLFIGEIFTNAPIAFVLPLLSVVSAILAILAGMKENGKLMMLFAMLTVAFFIITGFVGSFPYLVPSRLAFANGITIADSVVALNSRNVILIAIAIFFPIVFFYQGWKYKKFVSTRVNYNDNKEV